MLKNALIYLLLPVFFIGFTSVSPPAETENFEKLKQSFSSFLKDPALTNASVSFSLLDTETGKTVFAHNPEQSLIPASTLKLVATGAAMGILGENYTFKTILAYDSVKKQICIIGGGDPTLGSARVSGSLSAEEVLKRWENAIKIQPEIAKAKSIVAYAHRFENALQVANWAWNDVGNYYGAGAGGLSFNENTYSVFLNASAKVGGEVNLVKIEPEITGLTFTNELKSGPTNSGDQAYIFGAEYSNQRFLRGTIPAGAKNFKIKGSVPDPALFCAEQLFKHLPQSSYPNLNNYKTETNIAPLLKNLLLLDTIISPPLKDIIYQTNLKSVNLFAEHLLKECGFVVFNEGSTTAGIKAVLQFWQKKGINTDGIFMHDGSGLSHYNALNANHLTQMLSSIKNEKYFADFYNSLPAAGVSGAMKNMGAGSGISGKMRAKSGHMERIRSYAGFTSSGKKYAFALIVNNYNCQSWEIKAKIEKLLVEM